MISVQAVAFGRIEDMPSSFQEHIAYYDYWDDVITVGVLELKVTNATDKKIRIEPVYDGTIVAGNEQVEMDTSGLADVDGVYFSGVMKEGLVSFGLKRADVTLLDSIRYIVEKPLEADTYEYLADEDYVFVIPLR